MQTRLPSLAASSVSAALVVLCLGAPGVAPAQPLAGQLQALVAEFQAEQQGADAALAREFAGEAAALAARALSGAGQEASAATTDVAEQLASLLQERLARPQPAWNAAANKQLASDAAALLDSTRQQLEALGTSARSQLQSELADLGRQYVGKRNQVLLARVGGYVGRVKALLEAEGARQQAQARQGIDKAVAEFRAKLMASIQQARTKLERGVAGKLAVPRRR